MSVKRQLPPVPKSGDQQTKSWMSAVTEILRDLQNQSTLQTQTLTRQATTTVDVSALGVSKQSIGLGNVDNTSDKKKPLSEQMVAALGNKLDKATFDRHLLEQYAVGEWDAATDTDEDIGAQPGEVFKITGAGTYAGKTLFVGDYVQFYENDSGDLDVIIFVDPDRKADKTTQVIAGDGLSGGGTLASNRTLTLGTPANVSSDSLNEVTTGSHTHALADSGVTAGTYTSVTVNSKGIVTAGTTGGGGGGGTDWTDISGTPTTLSGYGITDAVSASDVVTTATASKLLKLDASAKLPADITGNAVTADKLAITRNIALSGAVTGSSSFDGSADISISATLADSGVSAGTYTKLSVDSKGLVTAGTSLVAGDIPALDWSKISSGKPTTLTGYGITDAVNASDVVITATANKLLKLDGAAKLPADITGNAATATTLATTRTIALTGDATGSASFDGSANASITATLANSGVTAGSYAKVTVNTKGLVTAGTSLVASDIPALDWSKIATGKPTTLSGYGITDAVNTSDVVTTATANKLLKLDGAAKLPADITGNAATATILATTRTLALTGDATGSASFDGSANASITTTLANSGVFAGSYAKVTVNSKGLVTAGTSLVAGDIPALDWSKITTGKPTTLSGYGIADGQPLDATLTALAGVTTSADSLIYATGSDAFATTPLTAAGRALIDDTDAAAQRTTLGLGSMAIKNTGTAFGDGATIGTYGLGWTSAAVESDLNTLIGRGQWFRWGTTSTNAPTGVGLGTSGVGMHFPRAATGSNDVQLAFDINGKAAIRACPSGTWGSWFPIYTPNNATPYNTTTATAANMVVTSTGEFQRSTSSMQYKTDVEHMWSSIANQLVDEATPIFYRSLCPADAQDWSWYGLSAEQLAAIDPRFVFWKTHEYATVGEGDGQREEAVELETPVAEGVFYDRLVVPLLLVLRELKLRVEVLEGVGG